MALPLLPGFSRRRNTGREKFHRSQLCGYANNVPMLFDNKRGIGGELLPGQTLKITNSVFPEAIGSSPPSWIAFDKQVLCFDAYFEEEVPDKNQELYRIRHCKIYFYPEDDTIQVIEPIVKNSGINQGTIVRRQQIPLPSPHEDQFYTIYHFNINTEITLYGRKYKIVDCDLYTKNFLRKIGIRLNPPASLPDDPYITERQKRHLASTNPFHPYERFDTLKQFLEFDGQVLGFSCVWNDPESRLSGPRELVLRYYLSDDTIDIREVLPENSGRDIVPYFLKRDKLPKNAPVAPYHPGTITNYTLLNVLGKPERNKGYYIRDILQTGAVHPEFYKDSDLKIGAVINVWGRQILLCDCDEFTKEHYRKKYGIVDFTPIEYKTLPPPKPEKIIPPYNGFGSEEDSLSSCMSVVVKAPHKDYRQFLVKDRYGMDSKILRYGAKLITDNAIDRERKFIISFFLRDDTISIFEYAERNSGIAGGKFLERGRIKKPGQELFKSEPSEYYKAQDLFVGARVCFHGHNFLLVDADEYTFNYMEKNANEFPMADISVVLNKLKNMTESRAKEIRKAFATTDPERTNVIGYDTFRNWIVSVAGGGFSEHEIMTLGRHYGMRDDNQIDLLLLLTVAQDKLKKNAFEYFEQLIAVFLYNDREKCGLLPYETCRTIFKSFKLPLPDGLLETLLARFEDNQKQVDYRKFIHALNWRENQIRVFKEEKEPPKRADIWNQLPRSPPVIGIRYPPLLDDLFGKEE
ncbi:EF-hand domain-containing family member C2 [Poecile atricapillus]|uniref:EF-hand domain-containing family member C2 n=1 Tax=Poecile atricapillus TaxID=48891 RepID=UPI002739F32C|nr:EF-hand domain-containing family member C2 [Poecile atricapillus]